MECTADELEDGPAMDSTLEAFLSVYSVACVVALKFGLLVCLICPSLVLWSLNFFWVTLAFGVVGYIWGAPTLLLLLVFRSFLSARSLFGRHYRELTSSVPDEGFLIQVCGDDCVTLILRGLKNNYFFTSHTTCVRSKDTPKFHGTLDFFWQCWVNLFLLPQCKESGFL